MSTYVKLVTICDRCGKEIYISKPDKKGHVPETDIKKTTDFHKNCKHKVGPDWKPSPHWQNADKAKDRIDRLLKKHGFYLRRTGGGLLGTATYWIEKECDPLYPGWTTKHADASGDFYGEITFSEISTKQTCAFRSKRVGPSKTFIAESKYVYCMANKPKLSDSDFWDIEIKVDNKEISTLMFDIFCKIIGLNPKKQSRDMIVSSVKLECEYLKSGRGSKPWELVTDTKQLECAATEMGGPYGVLARMLGY